MAAAAAALLSLCLLTAGRLGHGQAIGCEDSSARSVVATPEDAMALSQNLTRCPGSEFNIEWEGTVSITEPMELSNGTSLRITGGGQYSTVLEGAGGVPLFVVNASTLLLEGLVLTGGDGVFGGVVEARENASITFTDCDVFGNRASASGGAIYLDSSSFTAARVNFTDNIAEILGGVIYAMEQSTITTADHTENVFEKNEAKIGGVMCLEDGSTAIFGNGEARLTKNNAGFQGGAIYAENDCVVKTGGTTLLKDNEAVDSGGAMFAKNGSKIVATGNTSFIDNISGNYGGAVMVTKESSIRTRGVSQFFRNRAENDGGAIQAEYSCDLLLAGDTAMIDNSAGALGGAINGYDDVGLTTVGISRFSGNTAANGGAVYADKGAALSLSGSITFQNNTASGDGGALHIATASKVSITGKPRFNYNSAVGGSGGGIYCSSVREVFVRNAKFVGNLAVWGGGAALFSSGSQGSSSSSTSESSTRTSEYDSRDLTPSLSTSSDTTFADLGLLAGIAEDDDDSSSRSGSDADSGSPGSDSDTDSSSGSGGDFPVRFKQCTFKENHASEDGGGIYSVAGYDVIRESLFIKNRADSSGGALVHAGVLEELSDSIFEFNGAGNEGPAIQSLGLLSFMTGATFRGNTFYCEPGTFSATRTAERDDETCRFEQVCSRCASSCDSELREGARIAESKQIPYCEACPEGTITQSRGGTLETLEIQPGFFRSSATSTDVRECFHEDACVGGTTLGSYCAPGYGGPYCAVCQEGYSPGYSHTCKSCLGGRGKRAVGVMSVIFGLVLLAAGLIIARLVSVVEIEQPAPDSGKVHPPWRQKVTKWQGRARKAFPLTAVKIVVVVWQIVTQYSDVAGVKYPGAYNDFLAVIDLVNLDLGFILSFACVYDTDFYDRLLLATLGPFVVLAILGFTYVVARHRNRRSREAIITVKRRHLSVALFVMFVVYATVSYTVFETFVCDTLDDGQSYLRADYSVTCTTAQHMGYKAYAALMVVIYPVGFPCVFGWWLFKYREELKEEHRNSNPEIRPLADLWEPYKSDKYYYEVVECFRRIALTGFAVFIYPDSSAQIAIVLLLAAIFMVLSEILSPFARPTEMWLYRAGHYVVFASMYLALLLRVDVSSERDQSQDVFSGVIVIAHAVMLIVVVSQGLLIFVGWGDLVEAPEAFAGFDRGSITPNMASKFAKGGIENEFYDEAAAGCSSTAPWGEMKMGSTMISPTGKYCGDADEKDAGGGAGGGMKDKRWGAWNGPNTKAKSGFFAQTRSAAVQIIPTSGKHSRRVSRENSERHSRRSSREHSGSSSNGGCDVFPRAGSNGPWRIGAKPSAAARAAAAAEAEAAVAAEENAKRAAIAAEVHKARLAEAKRAAKARPPSPKKRFSETPNLGYPSTDTVVDSSGPAERTSDPVDATRVGDDSPSPKPEEAEKSNFFAAAMAQMTPNTADNSRAVPENSQNLRQFPGLKRSEINISNNSSAMTNMSTPGTFRDRFFGSPSRPSRAATAADGVDRPTQSSRAPRFGDELEPHVEEEPREKPRHVEETPRVDYSAKGGEDVEKTRPRPFSMPTNSSPAAALVAAGSSELTTTNIISHDRFASNGPRGVEREREPEREREHEHDPGRNSSRKSAQGQAERRAKTNSPAARKVEAVRKSESSSSILRVPSGLIHTSPAAANTVNNSRRVLRKSWTPNSRSVSAGDDPLARTMYTHAGKPLGQAGSWKDAGLFSSAHKKVPLSGDAPFSSAEKKGASTSGNAGLFASAVYKIPSNVDACGLFSSAGNGVTSGRDAARFSSARKRMTSSGDAGINASAGVKVTSSRSKMTTKSRAESAGAGPAQKRMSSSGDSGIYVPARVKVTSSRSKMTSKSRAESAGAGPARNMTSSGDAGIHASPGVNVTSSRSKMTSKSRAESAEAGPMGGRNGRWLIKPADGVAVDYRERMYAVRDRDGRAPTGQTRNMRGTRRNDGTRLARAVSTEDSRHAPYAASAAEKRRASLGATARAEMETVAAARARGLGEVAKRKNITRK